MSKQIPPPPPARKPRVFTPADSVKAVRTRSNTGFTVNTTAAPGNETARMRRRANRDSTNYRRLMGNTRYGVSS